MICRGGGGSAAREQELLQIRERLKEEIRQKALGGASNAGCSSSSHDRRPPQANFGSLFGPSKPVISQRVIEERKLIKEIQNTVPRDRRPPGVCGTTSDPDYYLYSTYNTFVGPDP